MRKEEEEKWHHPDGNNNRFTVPSISNDDPCLVDDNHQEKHTHTQHTLHLNRHNIVDCIRHKMFMLLFYFYFTCLFDDGTGLVRVLSCLHELTSGHCSEDGKKCCNKYFLHFFWWNF